MIPADRVLALLDVLESAGVDAVLDGGWGVDALLGRETREHEDLDLVVALADVERIQAALRPLGFALHEDHLPVRFVLRSAAGEQVDFHTVTFDAAGGGVQPQPGGGTFRYPPEGFVRGSVGGREVRCISAAVQILCHLGYEPTAKDARDVLALCRAFGIRVPAAYAAFSGEGGRRYAAQRLGLLALFALILFASAGTWAWPRGWGFVATCAVLETITLLVLAWRAPETLDRRGRFGPDVAWFDPVFAVLWLALSLATPVVAGLDAVRFGWSSLPGWWFFAGLAALAPASAFATWAMVENEHFEQFARIQKERDHRVVSSGPYRFVRHPGYLGAIVGALATPPMLGSLWTFVPAGLVALLFVARTHLEDAMLRRELRGYDDYAWRTRFRLLPGVW